VLYAEGFPYRFGEYWGMGFNREEIREWIREGWSFRVKTVKGKEYISRRIGDVEKGMGRYEPNTWRLIQNTIAELSERKQIEENQRIAMNSLIEALETVRTLEVLMNCSYIVDGYCSFWRYKEKPEIFGQADERYKDEYWRKNESYGVHPWIFKVLPWYCNNCPAFKPKENHLKILSI
jgi:hypothetical protein